MSRGKLPVKATVDPRLALLHEWLVEIRRSWDRCCDNGVAPTDIVDQHAPTCIVRRTLETLDMKLADCKDCKFHPLHEQP